MIDLRRDLFIRLAIAAKNNKNRERSIAMEDLKHKLTGLEAKEYDAPDLSKISSSEKIEDKITKIMTRNKYEEIESEIDNAERIFNNIKRRGINPTTQSRIESRLHALRNMVKQKMSAS
jgi:hypothetical protein